jgi:hypothetical protein
MDQLNENHKKLLSRIEERRKNFKEKYNKDYNNSEYKKFKYKQENFYLALLPSNLNTVSLKHEFKWFPTFLKSKTKEQKNFMQSLNNDFYNNIYLNTNQFINKTNNLIQYIKENNISDNLDIIKNGNLYNVLHYINNKSFSKDMYLFKTIYMFDSELAISLLDLGQISMIDNSFIYYHNDSDKTSPGSNFKNKNTRY